MSSIGAAAAAGLVPKEFGRILGSLRSVLISYFLRHIFGLLLLCMFSFFLVGILPTMLSQNLEWHMIVENEGFNIIGMCFPR